MRALALSFIPLLVSTVAGAQQAAAGRSVCLDAEPLPGLKFDTVRVSPSLYLGLSLSRTPARLAWAATGAGSLLGTALQH